METEPSATDEWSERISFWGACTFIDDEDFGSSPSFKGLFIPFYGADEFGDVAFAQAKSSKGMECDSTDVARCQTRRRSHRHDLWITFILLLQRSNNLTQQHRLPSSYPAR
jgi:hypothetical protein